MRVAYIVPGILLCLIGVGIVYYQVSESCEDNTLATAYKGYPWCTDVLDHINLTFTGVIALLIGVVIVSLGGPLHWILERGPQPPPESEGNRNLPDNLICPANQKRVNGKHDGRPILL